MGFREDFVNAVRRRVLPRLHYLFEGTFGGYAVSPTTEGEYALTAHCSEEELEAALRDIGFSRNPVAALKVRVDGNTSEGSWVWRRSLLADWQLHVVLHATDEGHVDVYAHWELSWVRHPYAHYAARAYDAERGVRLARTWLGAYESGLFPDGLPYDVEAAHRRERRERHYRLLHRVADTLSDSALPADPFEDAEDDGNGEGRPDVSPRILPWR
ncbi:hypothetical protein [Halomarina litorea]|uniref:hypothetical protein n=1 Tax=Halomarina litorea TaxID=2961595 RepID=UPI0020C486EF|nr:hypothetical protein [Halomarina sp. BCD28]